MKTLLIVLCALFILAWPVAAQDDTPMPAATSEATAESTLPAVSDPPASTATVVSENNTLKIVLAGIAFYVAGMASTLAGIAVFVRSIMANPLWMGLAEWIGSKTLTPAIGRSVHGSLGTIGEFVENASDGIAEADKPALLKIMYADGTTYDPKTGLFTHPDGRQSHDLVYRPPTTTVVGVNTTPDMFTSTGTPPLP